MTCYVLDGSVHNLLWPCNNSTDAHSTCCPAGSTCWSNGVCMVEPDDGPTDYLRAGCTDPTWSDSACLDECGEFARDNLAGIRPCDGIEESTNYCCDDGKKGAGSFHCCNDDDGIFSMGDEVPTILAEMPASWTSATEDMTATPGTAETSSSDSGDSGSSAGLGVPIGVGVGVGLPLAALIIGAGIFFSRRRKKSAAAAAETAAVSQPLDPKYHPQSPHHDGPAPPLYGQQSPVYPSPSPVYAHAPPPPQSPVYPQQQAPVELGTSQPTKHELP